MIRPFHPSLSRRLWLGLWTCAAVSCGLATAQPPPADPVEALATILKTESKSQDDLDQRKKRLQELTGEKALPNADLSAALALDAWKDQDKNASVAAIDDPIRRALIARFTKWMTATLEKKDKANLEYRLAAITLLGEMGINVRSAGEKRAPLAAVLAPQLAALLADQEASVREAAARALGKISPELKLATDALGKLLAGGDVGGRRAAAQGLAGMIRVLLPLATSKSSSPTVEIDRSDSLRFAELVAKAVKPGLSDKDLQVRRICLEANQQIATLLGELGEVLAREMPPPGRSPTTEEQTRIQEYRTQVEATRKEVRPLADALAAGIGGMTACLADADLDGCLAANQALEALAGARLRLKAHPASGLRETDDALDKLRGTVPTLAGLTTHKEVRVRLASLYVLETLQGMAAPAAPALAKALSDPDPFVRWGAVRALGRMAPAEATTAVAALATVIDDDNGDVRITALAALERYGPTATAAVPALGQTLNRGDLTTRLWKPRALKPLGPRAQAAVPALVTALTAAEPKVRAEAARVLAKIGPAARAAVPELRKALDDPHADVRRAASEALLALQR